MYQLISLFILFSIQIQHLKADRLPASDIMTREEQQAIGISSLTQQQQQAFADWAANWTKRVIEQAPSYRPGEPISGWVRRWPSYATPTKAELNEQEIQKRMERNRRIDKVKNRGETLELRDGSIWTISPVYRSMVSNWDRDQVIEIEPSANVRHPYTIRNVTLNQVAQAAMTSLPSETGEKAPEDAEQFRGSLLLVEITTDINTYAKLSDNSVWKIAPADSFRVRKWKPNDRIRQESSDNFLYKHKLTNLDNGEVALANPKK